MRRIRWSIFLLFGGIGALFLFIVLMVQISSSPSFCGSCHVMKPYYESWATSSHNKVLCVECHIPPGLGSEIRKKFEAISMAVQYITKTYGTNPWAEVEDASCLRCHDKRLIEGKVYFKGVIFDHTPHLLRLRRGKKLRCTSCHSQIVQGKHISATESTCFLCHFKDQKPGEGTARCELCHTTPTKVVRAQGVKFNHRDVKRFGMKCSWCHSGSIKGNGDVPKERCLVCHNDPSRLKKYEETNLLHRIHVTDHKVECLNCHLEIQHGALSLKPAGTTCDKCHQSGHNDVRDLYAGIGGKGVRPSPSKMFLTNVTCEGCHFIGDTLKGGLKRANEVSCMACHGPKFLSIYNSWRNALSVALKKVKTGLKTVDGDFTKSPTYKDVLANIGMVEKAKGIHNPTYAMDLLRWSFEQIKAASKDGKLPEWIDIPYETPCEVCHLDVPLKSSSNYKGFSFSHTLHVSRNGIRCSVCHRPHEEREKGEVTRPDLNCVQCHHTKKRSKDCSRCHRTVQREIKLKDGRKFPHGFHAGEDLGLECSNCHKVGAKVSSEVCSDCH